MQPHLPIFLSVIALALANAFATDEVRKFEAATDIEKRNMILLIWLLPIGGIFAALISSKNSVKFFDLDESLSIQGLDVACFPGGIAELVHFESVLIAAQIPYFVLNRHFGGLYPGPQIPWYNESRILVASQDIEKTRELIADVIKEQGFNSSRQNPTHILRMVAEFLAFGWCVPSDRSTGSVNKSSNMDTSDAGAG